MKKLSAIITILIIGTSSTLIADDSISGKIVKTVVENTLAMNNVTATTIINEKKLYPNCERDLSVKPILEDWKTVRVECKGPKSWQIVLRNKLNSISNPSKTVSDHNFNEKTYLKEVKVAAIKRSISRGDVITPEDVVEISIPVNKATDIFPDYEDLIGRRAKTTIKALKPVYSRQLETYFMIGKDMKVSIIHKSKYITVQMDGIALENGQYGDWINVKNIKSGRIILAKVVAEKKVNI